MRTEVITVINDHFDWEIVDVFDENDKKTGIESRKRILSDKKISKQILVTYDDNNVEIGREPYIAKPNAALEILRNSTPQELAEIKRLLQI